jgi:hypothetical protein
MGKPPVFGKNAGFVQIFEELVYEIGRCVKATNRGKRSPVQMRESACGEPGIEPPQTAGLLAIQETACCMLIRP